MDTNKSLEGEDYDFLEEYLMSENTPDNCMVAEEIDGFLTALICGPETVLPNQWISEIWGKGEPAIESDEQMERIMDIIFRMNNDISDALHSGYYFQPVLKEYKTEEGEIISMADDWCHGFCRGMQLWKPAWDTFMDDELYKLLAPILIAGHPEHDEDLI